MLISLHLASNNVERLKELFRNINDTAKYPEKIEILIKIDDEDPKMLRFLERHAKSYKVVIRYLSLPRLNGYSSLWIGYNELLKICDSNAYFVSLITDEFRYMTKHWDVALAKYRGLFPDHIFRLRISKFKLRNYFSAWECGYAPDSYAIFTKRWFDISGDWNACNTPDSFQQLVSFFLYRSTLPSPKNIQYSRDVPIWDIKIAGDEPYQGLNEIQLKNRVSQAKKDWKTLVSYGIQEEANHRAHRLKAYFFATENNFSNYSIESIRHQKLVILRDKNTNAILCKFEHRLNKFSIHVVNTWKMLFYDYYCGGNIEILLFIYRQKLGWGRDYLEALWISLWTAEKKAFRKIKKSLVAQLVIALTGLGALWLIKGHAQHFSRSRYFFLLKNYGLYSILNNELVSIVSNSETEDNAADNLLAENDQIWGSLETNDDVFVLLSKKGGFLPKRIKLMLFSPQGRCHIKDVSFVGIEKKDSIISIDKFELLPAKISGDEGEVKEKLTLPPLDDKETVSFDLCLKTIKERKFQKVGFCCFSRSKGYERNYLRQGLGIYLRSIVVEEH